ncbi:MauE/DoxX family redox-associated membrane protein [Actinopolymorpha pittospori]|nr:MauE/DoxX family redox-associated membrane protein [Actinopolymorpha pittospori]
MMLSASAAALVAVVLLAGAVGHAAKPSVLAGALRAHDMFAPRLVAPLAVAVPLAELAPALLAAHALLTGRPGELRAAMSGAAVLLCGYAAYAFHVARTREEVPCGCSAGATPMTVWVAVRAAALAVLAACAVVGADPAVTAAGHRLVIAALAGAVFGTMLWELPSMMTPPPNRSLR